MEIDRKLRKSDNTIFIVAADNTIEVIILVNNALAFTIQDSWISTSAGTEIVQKKFVGPFSTIEISNKKDGDSHMKQGYLNAGIENRVLKDSLG